VPLRSSGPSCVEPLTLDDPAEPVPRRLAETVGTGGPERAELMKMLVVRFLSPADAPQVERGFYMLSTESRRLRYGLPLVDSTSSLGWVAQLGSEKHVAVGACELESHEPVGVARYVRDGNSGELAVTVVDHWQGKRVGTLLLSALLAHARRHGISLLTATTFLENKRAIRLIPRAGGRRHSYLGDGVVEYELHL
jgi:RimJ/RimL family protein N-acetyltransferase